ncbi:MAG: hypothetical protein ACYTFQ_31630 [Planctomycetota bacterium]|jgi:hypothetical protein
MPVVENAAKITLAEVLGVDHVSTDPADYADSAAFKRGADYARMMEYISIAVNNVWGGRAVNGGCVSSYEKIGYHAGSVDFIVGALSAGCQIIVYRRRKHCRVIADPPPVEIFELS